MTAQDIERALTAEEMLVFDQGYEVGVTDRASWMMDDAQATA